MNTSVSFELAKILKEKNFDVKVRGRIHVSHWHLVKDNIIPSNVNTYHTDMFAPINNWNSDIMHFMSLPTIAEAAMWLYEKHSVWVECYIDDNGTFGYLISKVTKEGRIDFPLKRRFISPTEAYEAAIKYTLKNLTS